MSEEVKPQLYCDGCLRDCPDCIVARKLMEGYNRVLKGRVVLGRQADKDGDVDRSSPTVKIVGPFEVDCPACKNTGTVLTAKGRRWIGILKTWMSEALPHWAHITEQEVEQDAEIPF